MILHEIWHLSIIDLEPHILNRFTDQQEGVPGTILCAEDSDQSRDEVHQCPMEFAFDGVLTR